MLEYSLFIESKSFNNNDIRVNQSPKNPIYHNWISNRIYFRYCWNWWRYFLSPILFLMKAGYPKQIAATASLFILINSIFGVAGQLTKDIVFDEFLNFWPLVPCSFYLGDKLEII